MNKKQMAAWLSAEMRKQSQELAAAQHGRRKMGREELQSYLAHRGKGGLHGCRTKPRDRRVSVWD